MLIDSQHIVPARDRDLIDPMTGKNNWQTLLSTDSSHSASLNDDNVWDVRSVSTDLTFDGKTHCDEW